VKAVTLLIVLLSNQGYWLSNQTRTVSVQWSPKAAMPESDLLWELMVGPVPLASGKAAVPADGSAAQVAIKCPEVRVRTNVRWAYRLQERATGKELERGEKLLQLFPADLTHGWAGVLRDKRLTVCDAPDRLPRLLEAAKVPFHRADDASRIDQADVILIGEDQLDDSTFGQAALVGLAEAGSSVMIFRQQKTAQLGGYPLAPRPMPLKLAWKLDHPLYALLSEADLHSLLARQDVFVPAVQLPADEPALELAYWPRETPGTKPAPIEAACIVKSVGTGRIVLFQLPLGDLQQDPRSQMLVGNAIGYLLTPPQPTLRPSEREVPKESDPKKANDRPLSRGDQP
jgi:hypothetical protein